MPRSRSALHVVLVTLPAAVLAGYAVGRITTDRWVWSQWLHWIPTSAALMAALAVVIIAWRTPGRFRPVALAGGMLLSIALLLHLLFGVHRPLTAPPAETPGLRLAHWNPQRVYRPDAERVGDLVRDLHRHEDLTIITNSGALRNTAFVRAVERDGSTLFHKRPFLILSRLPIVAVRNAVATDDAHVVVLQIDASDRIGRTLTVHMVDLPSNPVRGRMAIARRVRALLDDRDLPEPDLVVGDFNMARDSAALATLYPAHRNAWDLAGHGMGGSFPSFLPLWHIDHTLVAEGVPLTAYRLDAVADKWHRAQHVVVGAGDRGPVPEDAEAARERTVRAPD